MREIKIKSGHKESTNKKRDVLIRYNSKSYVQIYNSRYQIEQYSKMFNAFIYLAPFKIYGIILDIGGGTGLLLRFIADIGQYLPILNKYRITLDDKYMHYIGCDLSIEMLRQFKKSDWNNNNRKRTLLKRANLICCDAENLPLRNDIADMAFSFTTLQNLPDIEKGFGEIKRSVNNKRYTIVISILKKLYDKNGPESILKQVFRNVMRLNDFLTAENGDLSLKKEFKRFLSEISIEIYSFPKELEDLQYIIKK